MKLFYRLWPVIITAILLLTGTVSNSAEMVYFPGRFPKVFDSIKVKAGTSNSTSAVYVGDGQGNFSIQYDITGPGNLRIEYLLSLNGSTWLEPSGASDISANATNATSPNIVSFSPELSETMKIKVTEISTSDNVTSLDLWLGRQ